MWWLRATLPAKMRVAPAGNERQDGIGYQLVVDDDVGILQDTQRLQGQQLRIARTGTDEMDGVNGLQPAVALPGSPSSALLCQSYAKPPPAASLAIGGPA